ncbi:MAG: hypothetical protein ACQESA_00970 [Patescibacteria group bacterium]
MEDKRKHSEHTERSVFLEAISCGELTDLGFWGNSTFVSPSSDYDDFYNGTDAVFEFEEDKSIQLCVDFKVGVDDTEARKRKKEISNNVKKGNLTSLKYFESSLSDYKGSLKSLPRVVVGTDIEGVKEIAKMMHGIIFGKNEERGGQRIRQKNLDKLTKHETQIKFLEDIKDQLNTYIEEARKEGFREKDEVIYRHREILNVIENILQEKKRSTNLAGGARSEVV